jgi:prolipoprotein diacylglyceryltransferase
VKTVTAVDVVVELAFGIGAGFALILWLLARRSLAHPADAFFSMTCGYAFLQISVDLLRKNGIRYAVSCAGLLTAGAAVGGLLGVLVHALYT